MQAIKVLNMIKLYGKPIRVNKVLFSIPTYLWDCFREPMEIDYNVNKHFMIADNLHYYFSLEGTGVLVSGNKS